MVDVPNVITCAKFRTQNVRGYNCTGDRIFDYPTDCCTGLTISSYCCACGYSDFSRPTTNILFWKIAVLVFIFMAPVLVLILVLILVLVFRFSPCVKHCHRLTSASFETLVVTMLRSCPCYRESVCFQSVCNVGAPYSRVEPFGNISSPICTLAIF